jgi:uncharacterized protein YdeI (YjbR/CyaY-like superfamily)
MSSEVKPTFFKTKLDFKEWLEVNHAREKELFVGYYKVGSGIQSMNWGESVDQALCFGWIDGVRKSIDKDAYYIRFTPRKPKSIWSTVNIKKMEELTKIGLMHPAGLAAFNLREESKSSIYAYEKEAVKLSDSFERQFKANKKAWDFFQASSRSYQKPAINWVMSAKQEATQLKRLAELMTDSEAGLRIKMLRR